MPASHASVRNLLLRHVDADITLRWLDELPPAVEPFAVGRLSHRVAEHPGACQIKGDLAGGALPALERVLDVGRRLADAGQATGVEPVVEQTIDDADD